jgi:hypothetical protein
MPDLQPGIEKWNNKRIVILVSVKERQIGEAVGEGSREIGSPRADGSRSS